MGITKYLIDNPIVKWMILGVLFLASLLAITGIKRYAYPRVDLNQLTVTTVVQGFSVHEIEIRVTRKINEKLKAIDGIKTFNSTSYPNYSFVFVEIDPDTNVEEVKTKIRNDLSTINDFPPEMNQDPQIEEIKIDNIPTMVIGITPADPHNHDPMLLSKQAQELRDFLLDSDQVSSVKDDIPEHQIHILLNKEKMRKYQITFQDVYGLIKRDQVRLSAGDLKSGSQVKGIITLAEKNTPEDIGDIILRTGGYGLQNSPVIRIRDIGKVEFALPDPDTLYHINGVPGYQIEIVKNARTDIIEFATAMEQLIEQYSQAHPDFKVWIHDSDSWETEQRLSIAFNNGFTSLALVAVSLFLFLKLPIAFWAIFEMPVTILLSIILIWVSDITINNVSLCGIILTLGIIVDNPTVIGELFMYYQDKGHPPAEASMMGLKKVFSPLIFSLLTTLISFASMFFIPGMLGDFAIEIPLTVTFMLTSSFIESVFILPSHLAHTRPTRFKPWGNRFLNFQKNIYHIIIRNVLKYPLLFFFSCILVGGMAAWWSSKGITFYLFSTEQSNRITITGKTPPDSNLDFTESQVNRIEEMIDALPGEVVRSHLSKIGSGNVHSFQIQIVLTPFYERAIQADEIRDRLSDQVKDSSLSLHSIEFTVDNGGPPSGAPIEINVFHPDNKVRKTIIDTIMGDLQEDAIFSEVNSDFEAGSREIQVRPKPEIYFSGIGTDTIAETLRFAFQGIPVKEIEISNQNTEWILKLDMESRNFFNPLEGLTVMSPTGKITDIADLVRITETNTLSSIIGEKGKTKNTISATFDPQKVSSQKVLLDLSDRYRGLMEEIPRLEITYSGEAKESFDTFQQFIYAILGSIILIYILLVIQFKNFTQPFLVVSSIPFGIMGIIFVFNLQDTNISFLTMTGILGFGGVVVNSSIIMIDFINDLRKQYWKNHPDPHQQGRSASQLQLSELKEIIIEGSLARFRPVIITVGNTMVGLFPMAYAVTGVTDSVVSPMTMGMMWGMFFGTTATLFIVPSLYLVNDRISVFIKKNWTGIKPLSPSQ